MCRASVASLAGSSEKSLGLAGSGGAVAGGEALEAATETTGDTTDALATASG